MSPEGISDFFIRHSKKSIIGLSVFAFLLAVVSVSLTLLIGSNNEVLATYGDKKVLKTEYEDAKTKCEEFYKYNNDDEGEKNCSQSRIEDQILRKALETEAEQRGITVTEKEINDQYQGLVKAYKSEKEYEQTIKSAYGWTPDYVKENIKRDILKEKLESYLISSRDVSGMFVRWDWYIGEPSTAQREPNKASAKKMMEDNFYPLMQKGASREELTAKITSVMTQGNPWDKEYNTGFIPFKNINAKTASKSFTGEEEWKAISKLQKIGDITDIVDSSGGYFVVYKLDKISNGNFADWDDFKEEAVSKAKVRSVSYKYKKIKNLVYHKVGDYFNKTKQALHISTVNATSCGWYSFSGFWGAVYDGSDHSLALNDVSVVATNNCPCEPGSAGCAQTRSSCVMCDQESFSYSQTTPNDPNWPGYFALGRTGRATYDGFLQPPYMLSCYHGWYLDLTKAGYDSIRYNKSTEPNGSWIAADRGNYAGWEWYSGPTGSYETWNTDGNGNIFMKPTPPPTYTLTVNVSPAGSGTATGGGTYNSGTAANVSASAESGYQFNSWSGDCSGTSSSTTVTMNSNKTCTANFSLPDLCSITADKSPVKQGDKVTLTWNLRRTGNAFTSFKIVQNPGNDITVNNSGSAVTGTIDVYPSVDTTYTLKDSAGNAITSSTATCSNSVDVTVTTGQNGGNNEIPSN